MSKKIQTLIDKCSAFEMLDGRVLIHPLKLRTYESVNQEPDYEKAKAENLNMTEDEMPMKQKIYDVNYAYQRAVVLKCASNDPKLHIGDTIIYKVSNVIAFDLLPNVSMLKNFEVIAIDRGGKNIWPTLQQTTKFI
jgi:hypothetical protein